MNELDYEFINIPVMDHNWGKWLGLPRDQRKDPDFSKVKFDLEIGMKIGIVYNDDWQDWNENWKDEGYFEAWEEFRESKCHSALVVPRQNIQARGAIDPSEAILCFYDYPCEKENPTTDFVTANKIFMNDDIYEVFELWK